MFEAAFIAEAQSEPIATVRTTAHVTRRDGLGLCADPKAQTAPEPVPRSGGRSVEGGARRMYRLTLPPPEDKRTLSTGSPRSRPRPPPRPRCCTGLRTCGRA